MPMETPLGPYNGYWGPFDSLGPLDTSDFKCVNWQKLNIPLFTIDFRFMGVQWGLYKPPGTTLACSWSLQSSVYEPQCIASLCQWRTSS